ncbi:hypothetical protein CRU99_12715 [Malaciobacter mytili]|uniref:hypothetical protein n=1 Tax=Malaciobacter mytili TaxID=603050 RepID=UPI00100C039D|nr:hypothetical protein [Malaciobacter mytili]RXI37034.1 hypothetical protein CRU99_12715 [Malaciobacter mytili]
MQKEDEEIVDNVVYDEFYRVKLTFIYYLFSKNALLIIVGMYFGLYHFGFVSFNAYLSLTLFALMFGYKQFFKAYRGDEFNIWLIAIFGDLLFSIKKRIRELYA